MDEALRRFALHFNVDFNISLMASDLGWVDAAAADVLQDVQYIYIYIYIWAASRWAQMGQSCFLRSTLAVTKQRPPPIMVHRRSLVQRRLSLPSTSRVRLTSRRGASNVLAKHLWAAELLD